MCRYSYQDGIASLMAKGIVYGLERIHIHKDDRKLLACQRIENRLKGATVPESCQFIPHRVTLGNFEGHGVVQVSGDLFGDSRNKPKVVVRKVIHCAMHQNRGESCAAKDNRN